MKLAALLLVLVGPVGLVLACGSSSDGDLTEECRKIRGEYEALLNDQTTYGCATASECGSSLGLCDVGGLLQMNNGVYATSAIAKLNAVKARWRESACESRNCVGSAGGNLACTGNRCMKL